MLYSSQQCIFTDAFNLMDNIIWVIWINHDPENAERPVSFIDNSMLLNCYDVDFLDHI
jgi:hypothetical protein